MSNFHHIAVIVAGGRGLRMNNPLPKQFQLLNNIPVLMHTIHAFHQSESKADIIVCLPEDQHEYWMDLCYKYKFHVPHFIADAGESRFQTVKAGLKFIQENPKWSGD